MKYLLALCMIAVAAMFAAPEAYADRTVDLAWDSQAGVSSYKVELSDGGGGWSVIYEGGATSVSIPDFPDPTSQVRISGFNGLWGPTTTLTVPAAAPLAITNFRVVSSNPNPPPSS